MSDLEAGDYTYYAAYPAPESVDGTRATYTLPAVQDAAVPVFSGAALPLAALYAPLWAAGGIICLVFRKLIAGNPPPKRV